MLQLIFGIFSFLKEKRSCICRITMSLVGVTSWIISSGFIWLRFTFKNRQTLKFWLRNSKNLFFSKELQRHSTSMWTHFKVLIRKVFCQEHARMNMTKSSSFLYLTFCTLQSWFTCWTLFSFSFKSHKKVHPRTVIMIFIVMGKSIVQFLARVWVH